MEFKWKWTWRNRLNQPYRANYRVIHCRRGKMNCASIERIGFDTFATRVRPYKSTFAAENLVPQSHDLFAQIALAGAMKRIEIVLDGGMGHLPDQWVPFALAERTRSILHGHPPYFFYMWLHT